MNRRRHGLVALLAGLILIATALPAYAAPRSLVALGDSWASGVGSFVYFNDGTNCYRSPFSYPSLIAANTGLSLTLAACSGATTSDVLNSQLAALPATTDYVTVSVGGNDLGFSSVLTACGLPGWLGDCDAAIDRALLIMGNDLGSRLDLVYGRINQRAPGARVAVTGYPKLFNGTDCNLLTFFTPNEMSRFNDATVKLNVLIKKRAQAAGFRFVEAVPAFLGHAWCDRQPWINGLTISPNSFHPTIGGHVAYAVLTAPALFGTPTRRPDVRAVPQDDVALPAVTSARGAARIATADLGSAKVSRAAARAGVTEAELRRLRAAQRAKIPNAQLDRLDRQITARAAKRLQQR